jgi:hypothetical protein
MTTDPLIAAARFLLDQLEWMRHATDEQGQPYAVAAYAEIAHCAGRMRSLLDGPPPKRYLGPCGAIPTQCPYCGSDDRERRGVIDEGDGPAWCDHGWHDGDADDCDGDIHAPRNGTTGRCSTCGATVSAEDRQQWLNEEVRAHAFRAGALAEAYRINVNTLRSWALRGRLASYWRTDAGLVAPWTDPPEGETRERLHYVGDVLDLAAADAARREEARAKRERRTAAKAADDERMSA